MRRITFSALTLVLAATARAQSASAPAAWPPALHWEALAFDGARDRIVLFGGATNNGYLAGTWAWRDGRWSVIADSASGPPVRHAHVMAYDPVNRRVVLHGGVTEPPGGPARMHCDTWSLDDAGWRRIDDGPCDGRRSGATSLVYDDRTRTMLLLEGPTSPPADTIPRPLRLWRLEGTRWTLADSAGPRRIAPGGAAWDARRGVLVVPVLEGMDAGVWEWDGARWSRSQATGPAPRRTFATAWAPHLGAVVIVGGRSAGERAPLADAWTWNGTAWSALTFTGAGPDARSHATLLADPSGRRVAYYGGAGARGLLRDLWWLEPGGWRAEPATNTTPR